jgi:hypothetical protein
LGAVDPTILGNMCRLMQMALITISICAYGADIWELMWGTALESCYMVVNLGRTYGAAMGGNVELRPSMALCFHKR